MTTLHEAAQLALELFERIRDEREVWGTDELRKVCIALRSALAQPKPSSLLTDKELADPEYMRAYVDALYEDRALAQQPMTDKQILNLVGGMQDCLCDPYDADGNGDYYSSIPKDMIRLARAVERYHDIGEKQ